MWEWRMPRTCTLKKLNKTVRNFVTRSWNFDPAVKHRREMDHAALIHVDFIGSLPWRGKPALDKIDSTWSVRTGKS